MDAGLRRRVRRAACRHRAGAWFGFEPGSRLRRGAGLRPPRGRLRAKGNDLPAAGPDAQGPGNAPAGAQGGLLRRELRDRSHPRGLVDRHRGRHWQPLHVRVAAPRVSGFALPRRWGFGQAFKRRNLWWPAPDASAARGGGPHQRVQLPRVGHAREDCGEPFGGRSGGGQTLGIHELFDRARRARHYFERNSARGRAAVGSGQGPRNPRPSAAPGRGDVYRIVCNGLPAKVHRPICRVGRAL